MRKREAVSARKLSPRGPAQSSPMGEGDAALAPGSCFEPVSWLALLGTLIGIYLTVAFPGFDPLAALLGQFP